MGLQTTTENWRKLRALTGGEFGVLLSALVLLPLTAFALRLTSFKWCQAALAGEGKQAESLEAQEDSESVTRRARSVARMVRIAAVRGPYRANCLPQSLVLWWLLRRQGITSSLRIGVRKGSSEFEAHAWIELHGVALNEAANLHDRFKPFDETVLPARLKFQ